MHRAPSAAISQVLRTLPPPIELVTPTREDEETVGHHCGYGNDGMRQILSPFLQPDLRRPITKGAAYGREKGKFPFVL